MKSTFYHNQCAKDSNFILLGQCITRCRGFIYKPEAMLVPGRAMLRYFAVYRTNPPGFLAYEIKHRKLFKYLKNIFIRIYMNQNTKTKQYFKKNMCQLT